MNEETSLAALSTAFDPALTERAGALTKRLRKTEEAGHVHHLSKADRLAAADLITTLLAQNAALREQVRESALQELASLGQAQEAWEAQKAAEAEVEKLRGALQEIAELNSPEKAWEAIQAKQISRAALTTEEGHE